MRRILECAGYAEDCKALEDSGGELWPREARRWRWHASDFGEVAEGGENKEACTRQMKMREGRGRRRRCRKSRSCRSFGKRG